MKLGPFEKITFLGPDPLPSRRCGYQFRVDELNNFLDIVDNFFLISVQNLQAIADIQLENYCYRREAQTTKSLCR
jgi:hypothetical protein